MFNVFLSDPAVQADGQVPPRGQAGKEGAAQAEGSGEGRGKGDGSIGYIYLFKGQRKDPFKTVLWIRIVLMRIRIRGSASGKTDPDPAHSELFLSFISAVFPSLYFRY